MALVGFLPEGEALAEWSVEETANLRELGSRLAQEKIEQGLELLLKAEGDMKRSAYPRLLLELLMLKLADLPRLVSLDHLMNLVEVLPSETPLQPRPVAGSAPSPQTLTMPELGQEIRESSIPYRVKVKTAAAAPAAAAPAATQATEKDPEKPVKIALEETSPQPAPVHPDEEKKRVLDFIRQENPPLASYLEQASWSWPEEAHLELDFGQNSFHHEYIQANHKQGLDGLLSRYFKRTIRVSIRSEKKPRSRDSSRAALAKKKLIKETLNNPLLKTTLELFKGEVVEVKTNGS
jgi:DNA polymerase-3 subunit gamma/tau